MYRKRRPELHAASTFKMPGGIAMVWVVFATAVLVTPAWFAVLGVAYTGVRKSPLHQARVAEWKAMSDAETASVR